MNSIILISSLFAIASGRPTILHTAPHTFYTATAPIQSQYHAQDSLGQYSYGYSGGLSAKSESKSFDGVTRGSYTYIDADGKLQSVEYTADSLNGFRAAATNLPKAPVDTKTAPEPVQDTPEVAQARAEHLAAFKEAETRAAANPEEPEPEQQQISADEQQQEQQQQQPAGEPIEIRTFHSGTPITTSIGTPISTYHPASLALRTIETPATAYSYSVQAPNYAYSIAAPAVYTSPLSYNYASPLLNNHRILNGGVIAADATNIAHHINADHHLVTVNVGTAHARNGDGNGDH